MSSRRDKDLSQDDLEVWHFVARDVRPSAAAGKPQQAPVSPARKPRTPTPSPDPLKDKHEMRHGTAPGLDRRTEIRLRRGKMPVEGRIDLHGLYQQEAREALWNFLSDSQARGRKCVLVITGKGRSETGATGILRRAAPGWLNEMGTLVHAFHYAAPKDGGEGALYVLLRRSPRSQ